MGQRQRSRLPHASGRFSGLLPYAVLPFCLVVIITSSQPRKCHTLILPYHGQSSGQDPPLHSILGGGWRGPRSNLSIRRALALTPIQRAMDCDKGRIAKRHGIVCTSAVQSVSLSSKRRGRTRQLALRLPCVEDAGFRQPCPRPRHDRAYDGTSCGSSVGIEDSHRHEVSQKSRIAGQLLGIGEQGKDDGVR